MYTVTFISSFRFIQENYPKHIRIDKNVENIIKILYHIIHYLKKEVFKCKYVKNV